MFRSDGHTNNSTDKRGFTLIELLVVVAIIGLLATLSILAFNSARAKARDALRMASIKQIDSAIEMYINDNNHPPDLGNPDCLNVDAENGDCQTHDFSSSWSDLAAELKPYIANLPKDPCGEACYSEDGGENGSNLFFDYVYAAPAIAAFAQVYNTGSDNDYEIYAENLESVHYPFGFGSASF